MKKKMALSVVFIVALLMMVSSIVFAASTTYGSSLEVSGNSKFTGSKRKYPQRNHRIKLSTTHVYENGKIRIQLHRKNCLAIQQ